LGAAKEGNDGFVDEVWNGIVTRVENIEDVG
jgi:hypothetical protein